jgi:predicted nuclease with TOPRIM domain
MEDEMAKLRDSMHIYGALDVKFSGLGDEKDTVVNVLNNEKAEADKLRLTIEKLEELNSEMDLEIGALNSDVGNKKGQIDGLKEEVQQLAVSEAQQRRQKNGAWTWIGPATTSVVAAASFVYAAAVGEQRPLLLSFCSLARVCINLNNQAHC